MYQFNNYRLGAGRHLPSFVALRSVLLFGIALFGLLSSSLAQPVCYDYNTSGSRVVRKNCPQQPVCQCPAGNPMLYQIGEEGESLSLSETDMYKQNTSGISGGCITVAGTLVIDANFSFSGVTMMMQPGAEIVINNSNFTLSLYGSTLKACSKLWSGINVGQSCTFNSWNSTIQDALYAVKLGHLSTGTISGTTFDKNHIGIFVDGSSSNVVINTSVTIKGNTFKCTGNLLPKWDNSTEVPKAGIEGINAAFDVGMNDSGSKNYFTGLYCGILASDCDVKLYYVDIRNLVGGVLNVDPLLSRNNALDLGIGAWYSNVEIKGAYIAYANKAVHVENAVNFEMTESEIRNVTGGILLNNQTSGVININSNIDISAQLVGIRLKGVMMNTSKINISSNVLRMSLKNPYHVNNNIQGYGIEIENIVTDPNNPTGPANTLSKSITNNTIYHHTGFHGISLSSNRYFLIVENKIYAVLGDLNSQTHGLSLVNTRDNKIMKNLSGGFSTSTMPNSHNSFAFFENNSPSNAFCCNTSHNTKTGFYFLGTNSNSVLRYNEIKNHSDNGLYIESSALIGGQLDHWNKWTGTYGTKAAKNDNITNLVASKFEVSKPIGNQWYPSNIAPTTGWFSNLSTNGTEDECKITELTGPCSYLIAANGFTTTTSTNEAMAYATSQYSNTPFGAYTTWSGQRWVLKQIETNPDWLSNTTINTFNVNNQNSNIKKINDLDVQLAQLEKPNTVQQTSLNTIYATMESNDKRLAQLSKLLAGKPSEADSLEYWTERSELLTDQAGMMGRMGKIQQEIRTARGAKLDQALALNASITAQNEFERNEKTINVIYLNTVAREDSMSVADKAAVTRIASLCPMVGGTAVFKARFLYGYYAVPSFDDTKLCGGASTPPPAGKVASNNTTSDVLMYPNPSSDEVYFSTSSTEPVKLILIDITGRVVAEQAFTSTTQISTRNLPSGQYFCQIWKGNQKVDTQKLSVIH